MKTKDILVSIIGLDEPGIVAATAETLTRLGCNIEQMTQTTLRDQFTAVYLVNKPEDIENKDEWGIAVVGDGCIIAPGTSVPPKAMIDAETLAEEAAK